MIQAKNLCLDFGDQVVFDDVSFTLSPDQRIGLVGYNGSGKSTLLKILAGLQRPDSGSVAIFNKKTVAYMPQEVVLNSDKSILDEALASCGNVYALQQELTSIEDNFAEVHDQDTLERYADLQAQLQELNPALLQAKAQRILMGLGFSEAQLQNPVNTLSVGWKMRVVLVLACVRVVAVG